MVISTVAFKVIITAFTFAWGGYIFGGNAELNKQVDPIEVVQETEN